MMCAELFDGLDVALRGRIAAALISGDVPLASQDDLQDAPFTAASVDNQSTVVAALGTHAARHEPAADGRPHRGVKESRHNVTTRAAPRPGEVHGAKQQRFSIGYSVAAVIARSF